MPKKLFDNIENYVGTVCSILMIAILFINVVGRYVVSKSIPWAEEVTLILFIQSIYFGATGAVRTRQHLRLGIILERLKPKSRMVLEIADNCIFMICNGIMLFGIMPLIIQLIENKTAFAVTGIPKYFSYIWLPVLFVLMIIRLIQDCLQHVQDYRDDPTGEKKAAREIAAMQAMMVDEKEGN